MMTVEEKFSQLSKIEAVFAIIGALCFICITAFTILHLGFFDKNIHHNRPIQQFLTANQLWMLNLGLGLLGGILIDLRRWKIAWASGVIASAGITAFTMFYLSWRHSFMSPEIIIILVIGMTPGLILYNILKKAIYAKKE